MQARILNKWKFNRLYFDIIYIFVFFAFLKLIDIYLQKLKFVFLYLVTFTQNQQIIAFESCGTFLIIYEIWAWCIIFIFLILNETTLPTFSQLLSQMSVFNSLIFGIFYMFDFRKSQFEDFFFAHVLIL